MRRMLAMSGAGLLVIAGCAGDSDSAVSVTSATSSTVPAPSTTAASTTVDPAATTTDAATTSTAPTTTAPPDPAPPDPPATDPPATTPPTATPAPTDPAGETPIATGATPLTPAFLAFDVSDVAACPAPDVSVPLEPREVTVSWEVIGAESVYVAIDNVDGPFEAGLPPAGSITLPHNCPDGNTYYVVAENPEGRTVSEATR